MNRKLYSNYQTKYKIKFKSVKPKVLIQKVPNSNFKNIKKTNYIDLYLQANLTVIEQFHNFKQTCRINQTNYQIYQAKLKV